MKTIQIKTLELLLIKALNSKNFSKDKIYSSFRYMLNHFSDDDYLYAFNHRRIISVIYLENFYAHKTVKALTQYLHIDNKTLLSYRKAYLKLFAKQYMNLASFKKQIFYFYSQLNLIVFMFSPAVFLFTYVFLYVLKFNRKNNYLEVILFDVNSYRMFTRKKNLKFIRNDILPNIIISA